MIDEQPGTAKIRRSKKKKQSVDRVKTSSWQVGEKMARYRRAHFMCRPFVMYSWNGKGRINGGGGE